MYVNSAHAPKNTIPATHITNNTTCTGNSRNHSKTSPIPVDTGAPVLGSVLGFVVSCFVGIPHTSSLAELLLRGVPASRQVVSWAASPGLEGGQVAVLRLHAASASHVTYAAYACLRGVYVLHGTKCSTAPRKRPNFVELRDGEVQHSPTPIGLRDIREGCPHRRVLCARCKDRGREGLRACYELGRKPHRNAGSTVALVPLRYPFPAFLRCF
jgi:hypothetical protein